MWVFHWPSSCVDHLPSIYGVGLKACSPAAKRLVKAGVADIAVCCGLGERARRPSRTSRSAILKDWHEHVTKSGTSFRGHYTTNPNDAPLKGKSLKMTIYLHCFDPPKFKRGSSSSILCSVITQLHPHPGHKGTARFRTSSCAKLLSFCCQTSLNGHWLVRFIVQKLGILRAHSNHPWKGTSINYLTGHYPPHCKLTRGHLCPRKVSPWVPKHQLGANDKNDPVRSCLFPHYTLWGHQVLRTSD